MKSEVDLRKPLLPIVRVKKTFYKVEYEGLPLICFECGRYGHRLEQCPSKIQPPNTTAGPAAGERMEPKWDHGPTRVSEASGKVGENFGPWMIAQRNNRRSRNPRDSNKKFSGGNSASKSVKESEKFPEGGRGGKGNRFDAIADIMEEDNVALDDMITNDSQQITRMGNNVVRNLKNDLEGHRVVSNLGKNVKSPTKVKPTTSSGPRNQPKNNVDLSVKATQGATRNNQGNKVASPNRVPNGGRDRGKAVGSGPLKENKTQNNIAKTNQRDRGPPQKPNTPVPQARSGPDLANQPAPTGGTAEELLRMMRYERYQIADQEMDSLDDLPVLRVHNDGF